MLQQHLRFTRMVFRVIIILILAPLLNQDFSPALAEDLAELSPSFLDQLQDSREQASTPPDLFLHSELDLVPNLPTRAWSPTKREKERTRAGVSTQQSISPSLSWEKHDQAGEGLLINIEPHFTRDPVETARSPFDQGEGYQKSPLNSNDLIYGLGVATDYELVPWLHFNSAFRFNLHNGKSNPGSSAASPGDSTSHSLFFGVTVPFSASSEK